MGLEHLDYDKRTQDIVRDKRYARNERIEIRQKEKEKRLEETLEKYETELRLTEKKRRKLPPGPKQLKIYWRKPTKIENTIRTIIEAQADKEKTRTVRKELEEFKVKLTERKSPQIS